VSSRTPGEVSFYLGLATATATFSAAAVALGLLQCGRWRERVVAVSVLLCGTLGIAAALATVARGRTSGVGNILIGIGVVVAAACVLMQALRIIFTVREESRAPEYPAANSSQTRSLPVIWTGRRAERDGLGSDGPGAGAPLRLGALPAAGVLHRPFWVTLSASVAVLGLAAVVALPDLFEGFFRSRPVGTSRDTPVLTIPTATTDPGPTDKDGDGTINRLDECPRKPADTANGCPGPTLAIPLPPP
jgi:hypothetical protein